MIGDGSRRRAARPRPSRHVLVRVAATACVALLALPALAEQTAATGPAPGRAAIASVHPLATEAGFEVLARGGNAFDAAVAVSAALAVVEPNGSGPGGGGFYLLHRASDGRQVVVDAREVAPAAATPDMFLDADGNPVEGLSTRHAKGAGIPGAPAGWQHLATAYGRLPLAASLAPAIRFAREGFVLTGRMSDDLERTLRDESLLDGGQREFARIYLVDGRPPPAGHRLRLPDLAATLDVLARGGADAFYRGPFAHRLVRGVERLGGLWTLDDLAGYRVVEREPVIATYRGLRVVSTPPPSSGGVWLASVLNVLSGYELDALDPTTRKHVVLEAMRRAHRDRAQYLGDPAFTDVPVRLLTTPDYAAGLRASIRADRATPSDALPGYVDAGNPGAHTTHFSVLDAEGNRVAGTITLNGWFGSGIVVPGTGILLNNQMDDFAAKAGVPNMYGLVGAAANALAPRLHHQYRPDAVFAEPEALTPAERSELEERGHGLRPWPATIGNLQVVTWDRATGRVDAASDPRWGGAAAVRPERVAPATH